MLKIEYSWGDLAKDYWALLGKHRPRFLFFVFLRTFPALAPFLIAFLMGKVVDYATQYSGGPLDELYWLAGSIALVGGFQVWLRFYSKLHIQTIGAEIRKEVRVKSMEKMIDLHLVWHEKEEAGSKMQKINVGSEAIYEAARSISNELTWIVISLFASLVLFIYLDIRYFLFSAAFAGLYFFGEWYFNRKLQYWETQLSKIKEKVSGKLHESTSNLLTVKSMGLKDVFSKHTSKYEKKYFDIWRSTRDVNQSKAKTIKGFAQIAYGTFVGLVAYDAVTGVITVGSILVYSSYFSKLKKALDDVTNYSRRFIQRKSEIGRFMTIFGEEIIERTDQVPIPKNWKKLQFVNTDFKYKDKLVLKNFNLTINRNDKIGVVGRTGCGKSTLVKLLLGLYEPVKGDIYIDDKSLDQYQNSSITKTISVVLQESEMFNMSMLDNITISSTKKDLNRFKQVTRLAQLDNVITKLPKGLNTLLGEKGYKLSGGERQRVGLARALYKDSPLLILDEATSSLDSKTEQSIQEGIDRLKDKTLLIIAHRFSTLKNVDKIIVMDKGRIVEQGSFKDLVKQKGLFYKLNKLQNK